MRKILLPADFSGPGQAALHFAADLAHRTGAELIVQEYAVSATADSAEAESPAPEHPELTYWRSIHPELTIRVIRAEDVLDEAVPAACAEYEPDLVVLGAIGTQVDTGILNENFAKTARHLAYPLLVVDKPPHLPLRRVLYVSDFSEPELDVFERMLGIVGVYEPQIHLLYVKNSQYFDMPMILAENVMRDFENRAVSLTTKSHIAQGGSVSQAVNDYIAELDIDLVVLGNQPRSLFYRLLTENVLANVLWTTDTPVLIVPRDPQ